MAFLTTVALVAFFAAIALMTFSMAAATITVTSALTMATAVTATSLRREELAVKAFQHFLLGSLADTQDGTAEYKGLSGHRIVEIKSHAVLLDLTTIARQTSPAELSSGM